MSMGSVSMHPDALVQVFFCSASSSAPALRFRRATNGDYLGSHLRRHVLAALPQREVEPGRILGDMPYTPEADLHIEDEEKWILRDGANRLAEWQQPSSVEHWNGG
jgi:hypothetical protein